MLTWKCASRHSAVHFFDISTSKSAPNVRRFLHFHLETCFAPQRRILFQHLNFQNSSEHAVFCTFLPPNVLRATTPCTFQHLNFQKRSDAEVLCTFSLQNLLRATTACNFSSLISTDVSAPAALASYFSTLRSHKTSKKHSVSRLSCLFAHLHLLSSNLFSSDSCPF